MGNRRKNGRPFSQIIAAEETTTAASCFLGPDWAFVHSPRLIQLQQHCQQHAPLASAFVLELCFVAIVRTRFLKFFASNFQLLSEIVLKTQ